MAFDGNRGDPRPRKRPMVFGIIPKRQPAPPPPAITLLTDFGTDDIYVGVMKGVLRRLAPHSAVIDLTHAVAAQDVVQGAFLLEQAWRHFPPGTVHLVVVDPGVGTSRRRLALKSEGHYFVGPDNGVLSAALPDAARGQRSAGQQYEPHEVDVPQGVRAVAGEGGAAANVSATFEGRDVFGPAAAFLANGGDLEQIGRPVERLLALPAFRAPELRGVVLHVDRYGNLVTDIRGADLSPDTQFEVAGRRLRLVRTYGEASELCAIVGSGGYVEVALPNGSAAAALGLGKGAVVTGVAP
jgi:S-adenosylmethionine hydrolase